jgi:predicted short-subunit dehydrogenase-like oxidoreductase (DUF2520 family)
VARPDFALVGPGRLGLRLADRLVACGFECVAVRGRHPVRAQRRAPSAATWDTWDDPAEWRLPAVVFVCVPDHAIAEVGRLLACRHDLDGVSVLHTSGLLTADALDPVRRRGGTAASWHPLQSFPPADLRPTPWDGVACAVEGDPAAVEVGFEVATILGLRPWHIQPVDKPLYHAAAATAANLTYLLVASTRELFRGVGLPATDDPHPLAPLLATVVSAALSHPGLTGLTGPLARGDRETVARHLQILPPPLADAYRALARLVEDGRGEEGRT